MRRQAGFTLIEVLIAIAIMAMLSVLVFQTLNGVQRSNQVSQERSARLEALQRAVVVMDNDFRQIVARAVREPGEETPGGNLIQVGEYLLDSTGLGVAFSRSGWQNPQAMFNRGEISRVGYRLNETTLERVYYRYPDAVIGEVPLVTPVLEQVEGMKLAFYDAEGEWKTSWDNVSALPKGVRVTLTLEDYGDIERIYAIAAGKAQTQEEPE